jgi:hypothetical protein
MEQKKIAPNKLSRDFIKKLKAKKLKKLEEKEIVLKDE